MTLPTKFLVKRAFLTNAPSRAFLHIPIPKSLAVALDTSRQIGHSLHAVRLHTITLTVAEAGGTRKRSGRNGSARSLGRKTTSGKPER